MAKYDREKLIKAIDSMHEQADWNGWIQVEDIADALGWTDSDEMPDGTWLRARLDEVLK